MGVSGANHFLFLQGGKSLFSGVARGGEVDRKWVGMPVVPFRGENQQSGTFYGVSNFGGLPET